MPRPIAEFTDAAGNENVAAIYYLGKMMMYGEGCNPDPEAAVQWLLKSAEKNNDKAQFELGNAYLTGNGVEENDEIAMEWFENAAERMAMRKPLKSPEGGSKRGTWKRRE